MSDADPDPLDDSIDALVAHYVAEAHAEFDRDVAAQAQEERRLRAAFQAGAKVVTLRAVTLYDPVEGRQVETLPGDVLEVASDEGDVFIDRLANNTHSIGVLYEERQHWSTRKYFMPLATFCNPSRVGVAAEEAIARRGERVRYGAADGADARSRAAIQELEALDQQDADAVLPRGTLIILKHGAAVRRQADDARIELEPGTIVEVLEAYGDTSAAADEPSNLSVVWEQQALWLPVEALAELDHGPDVLTPFELEQNAAAETTRRVMLRRAFGAGLVVTLAGITTGQFARMDGFSTWDEPPVTVLETERRQLISTVVPQLGLVFGYLGAGGKYWFELQGLVLDLQAADCLPAAQTLAELLKVPADLTSALWMSYEGAYYRRVHTRWVETRHYRTDSDGNRKYSHSSWSKGYSMLWVEPPGLGGLHSRVQGWATADLYRRQRGARLRDERIFNLLEANKENPEADFKLRKRKVAFARDAATSALSAAFMTLPATFYDDVIGLFDGDAPVNRAVSERFAKQKGTLALAGAVVGMLLGERYRRRLDKQLRQNRYELGETVETQLRRVPTLSLEHVWLEFFGCEGPDVMPPMMHRREPVMAKIVREATSFSYTYGSGYDGSRSLDSIYVDSGPVTQLFDALRVPHKDAVEAIAEFLQPPQIRAHLLRILRNVVGTELLDAQVAEDEGEARGGSVGRSWRFAAPVWGAMVLDALLKA